MTFKPPVWSVAPVVLALTGAVAHPLESGLWRKLCVTERAVGVPALRELAGQGVVPAVLGGFRGITADALWLEANLAWERNDLPATHSLLRLTAMTDPRPLYFWLNGARIMACDMPAWRLAQAGRDVPQSVAQRINEEQAALALEFLRLGLRSRGDEPELYIEMANIHLRRRGDAARAAEYYRRAALLPRAPYYAARIHAELLRALGRKREALEWLRTVYPQLPADDPAAQRDVVLARLRELEQELGQPAKERR